MGGPPESVPKPRDDSAMGLRAYWASVLLLAVLTTACIWSVDYFPGHDTPNHIFQGYLENHYADAGSKYAEFFDRGTPITSLGYQVPFSLVEPLVGWRSAHRAVVTFIALFWAFGFLALVWSVAPARKWLGLLGFAAALNWTLYMGFYSFALSCAIAFCLIGLCLREAEWSVKTRVSASLLLLLQALTHLFGALSSGLVLGCMALSGVAGKGRLKQILWLALMSLPVMGVLGIVRSEQTGAQSVWLSPLDTLALSPRLFLGGPAWRTIPLWLLGLGGSLLAVFRTLQRNIPRGETALGIASVVLWGLALAAPLHLKNWEFFSPRFLVLGAMTGIALVPVERLGRAYLPVVSWGCVLVSVASLSWAYSFTRDVRQRMDVALSGLNQGIHREGPTMTVVFDPFAGLAGGFGIDAAAWRGAALPYFAPLFNLGMLYAVAQGGIPTYVFSDNPLLHSFVRSPEAARRIPPAFDPTDLRNPEILFNREHREQFTTFLAALGAQFEGVVVYGDSADADAFSARGYAIDFRRDQLLLGHFQGCPLPVSIVTPEAPQHPIAVEYGWGPAQGNPVRLSPAQFAQDGGALTITRNLCGDMWIRIYEDRDDSGSATPADRFCAGAHQGILRGVVKPQHQAKLECRMAP